MEMKKLLDLQRVQLQSNEDDSDSCAYSSRRNNINYLCAEILFILKGIGDEKFFQSMLASKFSYQQNYWCLLELFTFIDVPQHKNCPMSCKLK